MMHQSKIDILQPELKPNSSTNAAELPSAKLLPNPLLGVVVGKPMELFEFELTENESQVDEININRVCIFVSDEQKKKLEKLKKSAFKKYGVNRKFI